MKILVILTLIPSTDNEQSVKIHRLVAQLIPGGVTGLAYGKGDFQKFCVTR